LYWINCFIIISCNSTNFVGGISFWVILLSILIVTGYIKSLCGKFDHNKIIRGYNIFLHHGMLGLCTTSAFIMAGIRILFIVYPAQYHMIILLIVLLVVAFVFSCYVIMVDYLIKKDRYHNVKAAQGGVLLLSFAALGMGFGRSFLNSINNETALKILVVCLFGLASLYLLGTLGLYKYYHIIRNPELIKEVEEILKKEDEKREEFARKKYLESRKKKKQKRR
jgi:hypothetical protein